MDIEELEQRAKDLETELRNTYKELYKLKPIQQKGLFGGLDLRIRNHILASTGSIWENRIVKKGYDIAKVDCFQFASEWMQEKGITNPFYEGAEIPLHDVAMRFQDLKNRKKS